MSLAENLEKLSKACGVAGREGEVRNLMMDLLRPHVDEVSLDRMENVIAVKKGKRDSPKIMFAAHIDEVGLMVKTINKDGFIQFAKMGGIDDRILLSQRVNVLTEKSNLPGMIGAKPPHVQKEEERKKIVNYDDMFIDIGAENREDAKAMGVKVGDPIAFESDYSKLNKGTVMGKAFDDRAGCAVMLETIKMLSETDCTVYAVGTIQEEVGLRGAATATFGVDPDVGLALDVTIAGDVPGMREFDTSVKMGKGPVFTISDSGLITHRKVLRWLIDTASQNNIDYQLETGLLGTTDAARMAVTREGVPSGTISIPARYIHNPSGLVNLKDLENCAKLAALAVEKIQSAF
jgi:putative aminopeptidase FrvX